MLANAPLAWVPNDGSGDSGREGRREPGAESARYMARSCGVKLLPMAKSNGCSLELESRVVPKV